MRPLSLSFFSGFHCLLVVCVYVHTFYDVTPLKVFVERKVHAEGWTGEKSKKERFMLPRAVLPQYMLGTLDLPSTFKVCLGFEQICFALEDAIGFCIRPHLYILPHLCILRHVCLA
jgi:hypothetical protein